MQTYQNQYGFDFGLFEVTATLRYTIDWGDGPYDHTVSSVEIISARGMTDFIKDKTVLDKVLGMVPDIHEQMIEDAIDFQVGVYEHKLESRMEFGMAD